LQINHSWRLSSKVSQALLPSPQAGTFPALAAFKTSQMAASISMN
jgi:hypothetical protein